MQFHQHTTANGLQIIGETNSAAHSVSIGFFVRTGSRDETPQESGVSHFLEHMVFKGTEKRTFDMVNRDFDRIGASHNAYTSEEHTVFYAMLLPEFLPQAIDIYADILRPSLRESDFEMEKQVILDEIGMYADQPYWVAYDHVRKLFFDNHPLGNTVLGTTESIQALTRQQMLDYFQRRYLTSNIVVVAAGNFEFARLVAEIERACAHWPNGSAPRQACPQPTAKPCVQILSKPGVAQEYVMAYAPGPANDSPLRYAVSLLSMAVGDETGSRLARELVDPGHADTADMGWSEYDGAGLIHTSFCCDPERTQRNLHLVQQVLAEVQANNITAAELQQVKNKANSRLVRSAERSQGRMRAIAASWIMQHEYLDVDAELAAIDAVSLDDIRAVLDQYPLTEFTTLAYGPLEQLA